MAILEITLNGWPDCDQLFSAKGVLQQEKKQVELSILRD